MTAPRIGRRAVLKGLAGTTLVLPALEAMGEVVTESLPRRFCAVYTANGMALPKPELGIDEWHWFPGVDREGRLQFGESTKPLEPFADHLSFFGGLEHENGPKADSHICSDMWLTGAPLQDPKPGRFNSVSLDQVVAEHTKPHCRHPSLVLSIDSGVGFLSRTSTLSYDLEGRPIPAENSPRRVFDRLFRGDASTKMATRDALGRQLSLVDAVLESANAFSRRLGPTDRETMQQYLASLDELEARLVASERWMETPVKDQDRSFLDLDASPEGEPATYYRSMFDLVALAFDADLTRSVSFMLSREDGMGISDTFPLKLGLPQTHHNLSHAGDREGLLAFAKYDRFLSEQLAYFFTRLASFHDREGTVLDNTLVLYGSGCSTTHWPKDLPTLVAGGRGMGLSHGHFVRDGEQRMTNLYVSLLKALGIEQEAFADSTGSLRGAVFEKLA